MAYLEKLDDLDQDDSSRYKVIEGCIYLYFWIYEKELHKSTYNNYDFDIYKKLLKEYDTYNRLSNINSICSKTINDVLNGKLKNLYYLYYKFYKLKKENEGTTIDCKSAQNCAKLYMECIDSCDNDINGLSCAKLEKFRTEYNKYMKQYVSCEEKYTYLPSAIKFDRKTFLISVLVILTIICTLFGLYKVNINFN
ncbi:hypothetical protein PVNG_06325 [Plasmodium vivax North Korean]|uniref:Variable surface protein n=1 Tax=Plasmodium vivax North Korean TaxID=1035514 RepID=A0A0J9TKX7_PLAVI|nr:hypothetical protein PVNG_06325 [Plasmodium vivax North Korean]